MELIKSNQFKCIHEILKRKQKADYHSQANGHFKWAYSII